MFSVLIIGGFGVGRLTGSLVRLPIVDVRFGSEVPHNVEQTRGALPGGDEVVLMLITSSHCAYCTDAELASLVREAAVSLRRAALGHEATLVSIGVALNWIPGEGWRFLERIMNFDEVVIGRNWLNSKIVELGWSYPDAEMTIPQIVVYKQTVVAPVESRRASISRPEVIVRVIGPDAIRRWVEAGCPFEWKS
jgi:hypothetical protein